MSIDLSLQRAQGDQSGRASCYKVILASVFGLVALFLLFSPNFQSQQIERLTPLGSDFLQEWTGGYVWLNHRDELYEAKRFVAVQHDTAIIGFQWPAEQFYPMVYPPFYYMLISPLSLLPYQGALVIWMFAIGAAIAVTLWMLTRYHPQAGNHWRKCLAATLVFYPLLMSLNTAHKSAFLLLILTATYLLLYHRRPFAAGLAFGLIAFKPHLGLVIGFAMLAKRQWRFVAGCAATVSALLLLSLIAGWDLCQDYFWQCISMSDYISTSGYQLAESHSLVGATALMFGSDSAMTKVLFRMLAILIVAIVGFGLRGKMDTTSYRFAMQFSLLLVATVLLSPHFYVYDLTIMLLPIGLIALNFSTRKESTDSKVKKLSEKSPEFLIGTAILLFVIAGLSASVASSLSFQPTLPILFLMAIGLAFDKRSPV